MPEAPVSIAVLPFENLAEDPDTEYFARGFVEDVTANLTRFPTLRVVASQSAFGWERGASNLGDLAREWGLGYVLEGSVRRRGDTLRVGTKLTRLDSLETVWGESFDVPADDVFRIQDEIAATVAGKLSTRIDESQLTRTRGTPMHDLAAYDCWLRGSDCLRRGSLEGDEESRPYFERALEIEPHYARAYAGLSVSHFNEWSCQAWHLWDTSSKNAFDYATKAAELDDGDAMIQAVLARVCRYRREHARADRHAARAFAFNPNDADVLIQIAIATLFGGDAIEAYDLAARAMHLNPLHPPWYPGIAGWSLFMEGQVEEALPLLERAGDSVTDFAAYRAACAALLGDRARAAEEYEQFERTYRERIAFGREPAAEEALRWAVQVEPFREERDSHRLPDALRDAGLASIDVGEALASRPESMVRPADIARPSGSVFRCDGRIWTIDYEGTGAQLTELKGFHDIARLLQTPDAPVHCLELCGAAPTTSSRQEVLDPQARREYRRRIEELQEEIDGASSDNDPGRADAARRELEAVMDELAKAAGLGGRSRAIADEAERARSARTWRIRSAIKKIRAAHPRLGQHLANSVRTGVFCVYAPEAPVTWTI